MTTSQVVALRHAERDESAPDPQTLSPFGELCAYAMGMQLRRMQDVTKVTKCTASPQLRCRRATRLMLAGLAGYQAYEEAERGLPVADMTVAQAVYTSVHEDNRLNDWSSDERDVVRRAVIFATAHAKQHVLTPGQVIFALPECRDALRLKADEAMKVVEELSALPGDHLIIGHEATVDAVYFRLHQRIHGLDEWPEDIGMAKAGGQFRTCEGFLAGFSEDGKIEELGPIRWPAGIGLLNLLNFPDLELFY